MKYRLIDAEKTHHGVSRLARVLGVSRQGYYAWKARGPSRRGCQDQALTETIVKIHTRSRHTYGARASTLNYAMTSTCASAAKEWPG